MIRVLHFADLHLGTENYGRIDPNTGLSSRLGDFLAAYDFIIEYALNHEIDLVVFAGDAFKNRDPSPTHQREFAKRIRALSKAEIPTFLLVGNHDLPNATRRAHAIEIFSTLAIPHVTVAARPGYHRIETRRGVVQIVAVPWVTRAALAAMQGEQSESATPEEQNRQMEMLLGQMIQHYTAQVNDNEPALLVGHGTVAGAQVGAERNIMLGQDVLLEPSLLRDSRFNYVALGHIHRHQDVFKGSQPPIVYSGSPERIDFGEEEEKGFVVAEIGDGATRWEFIHTPTRKFRQVKINVRDQGDPMPFIRSTLAGVDVRDAIVKLIIEATPENESHLDLREIRALLKEANHIAAIVRDVERPRRLRLGTAEEIANLNVRELLERYLESKQVPAEQRAKLLARAENVFTDPE